MGIHRNQRGLTLVELMIAMAVGVLLLLGVSLANDGIGISASPLSWNSSRFRRLGRKELGISATALTPMALSLFFNDPYISLDKARVDTSLHPWLVHPSVVVVGGRHYIY